MADPAPKDLAAALMGKPAELRQWDAPWYKRLPYAAADFIYGPNATAQQTQPVINALGVNNPLNIPAQAQESGETLGRGVKFGDAATAGMGALGAGLALLGPMAMKGGRRSGEIVSGYHGSRDANFNPAKSKDVWVDPESGGLAKGFGNVHQVDVDTTGFLKVPENSLMQRIDDRYGSGAAVDGNKDYVAGIAKALGYKGIDYSYLPRDGQRVLRALDPRSVSMAKELQK